jgi:hypothetical protein
MKNKKNVDEIDMEQSNEEINEEDLDQKLLKELSEEWEIYPNLKEEFHDKFYDYYFFRDAELKGQFEYVLDLGSLDVKSILEIMKKPPYRQLLVVRDFAREINNMYAGKGKRGKEGAIKLILRRFIKLNKNASFKHLISSMEEEHFIDNLYYGESDIPPLDILEVDYSNKIVNYIKQSGEVKPIKFSSLESEFSRIKNSR